MKALANFWIGGSLLASMIREMTEVKQCWARLVLGWEATSYCTMCQPNLSACSAGFVGSVSGRLKMGQWNSPNLRTRLEQRVFNARGLQTGAFEACKTNFIPQVFQLFHLYTGSKFLLPQRVEDWKWNSPNLSETEGFQCLGRSNWTICSPLSQFCPPNFPTFSLLYRRGQFLLPQREKGWKWGNGILPTGVRHRFFSAWGI